MCAPNIAPSPARAATRPALGKALLRNPPLPVALLDLQEQKGDEGDF